MRQKRLEKEFLLCFLKDQTDPETKQKILDYISRDLDWDYLVNKTLSHGVSPLFYHYLKQSDIFPFLPPEIGAVLKRSYYQNAYINSFKYRELAKVLDIIKKVGLR